MKSGTGFPSRLVDIQVIISSNTSNISIIIVIRVVLELLLLVVLVVVIIISRGIVSLLGQISKIFAHNFGRAKGYPTD